MAKRSGNTKAMVLAKKKARSHTEDAVNRWNMHVLPLLDDDDRLDAIEMPSSANSICRSPLWFLVSLLALSSMDNVAAFSSPLPLTSRHQVRFHQRPPAHGFPPTNSAIPIRPTSSALYLSSINDETGISTKSTRATAVYVLMLINLVVFLLDKVVQMPFVSRQLYLFHHKWKWWQPLTTCFCHGDRFHLCNNLFLLLLFGRSVEDDQGWGGLLLSYIWCGVLASMTSLWLLPSYTVSIGASGAVFGLFAVSMLAKLSWSDLDWRKVVEVAVLGEFVFRQITSEISTAAGGGRAGINHVAHLSGAAAGALLVYGMRATVARYDRIERDSKLKL